MLSNAGRGALADNRPGVSELPHGADVILLHGKIWTGEPAAAPGETPVPARICAAAAIVNGRILALGGDEEMLSYEGPNTAVVDLGGRLVVPGLADSHVHFIQGGFRLLNVDLKDAHSEEEFTKRIAERVNILPPGRWMQGGRWMRKHGRPRGCLLAG